MLYTCTPLIKPGREEVLKLFGSFEGESSGH